MNKQLLKYTSAVALLLDSSAAKAALPIDTTGVLYPSDGVVNHPDGHGGPAPCLDTYTHVPSSVHMGDGVEPRMVLGESPHAYHGIQTADEAYVATGQGGDGGFIFKGPKGGCQKATVYSSWDKAGTKCGTYQWVTRLGEGKSPIWSAETPDGLSLIVAGAQTKPDGSSRGMIWKVNSADGAIVWEMPYDPSGSLQEEFETVQFTSDGGAVIGGAVDIPATSPIGFKSTGIMNEGKPFIAKISASDVAGSKTPSKFEWTFTEPDQSKVFRGGAKSMRINQEDKIIASVGGSTTLIQIDGVTGQVEGKKQIDVWTQNNDLVLAEDGGIVLAGLQYDASPAGCKTPNGCTRIKGSLMKIDDQYNLQWKKTFGNYPGGVNQFAGLSEGPWPWIYTECWGMTSVYSAEGNPSGYALQCGTGIEGCEIEHIRDFWAPELQGESCTADPRSQWRSLLIVTDLEGNRIWSRQDNMQQTGQWADPNEAVSTTGGEYVFTDREGKLVTITDEAAGLGFIVVDPNQAQCDKDLAAVMKIGALSQASTNSASALLEKKKVQQKKIAQIKELVEDL